MRSNYRGVALTIIIGTFVIYLVPASIALLSHRPIMPEFYPVNIISSYAVLAIYLVVLASILLLYFIAPAIKINLSKIKVPRSISSSMIVIYLLVGIACFIYMFMSLGIPQMLQYLIYGRTESAKFIYNNIASQLNDLNLLKYYFISTSTVVGFYILFYSKPKFLVISLLITSVLYVLLSRREIVLFILGLIVVNPWVQRSWKLIIAIGVAVTFFAIVIIRVIDSSGSSNMLYEYYSSQEFYPYQFGAVLLDKLLHGQIKLGLEGISLNTTLAGFEQARFFNFQGFGPTVGIAYPFIRVGFILPSLYMLFYFSIFKTIGLLAKKDRIYDVVLIYMMIKLFVLLRNGEFVTNLVDIILFLTINLPILVISMPTMWQNGRKSRRAYV